MTYSKPELAELGHVHTLTLKPGPDDDPGGDQCDGSIGKCLGTGDGKSQEAGFDGGGGGVS